ncbi:hypothetical protein ACPOL_3209 [Acidisarcina polymorpha]|uniref:Uncharacterized protein n=1 Tax=Acidisarcina polymorpha TaxID=2211140 RepID=A0A2Z5G152_9BACT|nr:hypothetical protein [Acidisarcina polymorpha]AXC12504.1 hypothetical protein ACPOL_3209 [Acidisarcina polymorpha]
MSAIRRITIKLTRIILRHAPADRREWAAAMGAEADSIENDLAALLWLLGSAVAITRMSGHPSRKRLKGISDDMEGAMKSNRQRALGMFSGVGIAVLTALCAFSLLQLLFHLIPSLNPASAPWLAWLVVLALPQIGFFAAATALWQKRRSMALGILLSAVFLGAHVAIHLATHGDGQ